MCFCETSVISDYQYHSLILTGAALRGTAITLHVKETIFMQMNCCAEMLEVFPLFVGISVVTQKSHYTDDTNVIFV